MASSVESPRPAPAKQAAPKKHSFDFHGCRFELDLKYTPVAPLGRGTFGCVISVLNSETGRQYALKKVTNAFRESSDGKRLLREIRALRQLRHPNIMGLHEVLRPASSSQFDDVYLVTDLMETDVHRVLRSSQPLSGGALRLILYQLLCALKYMHSADLIHRDIKPANMLANSRCEVKLCDFGLCRGVANDQDLSSSVVTRWYRAPEVLLGNTRYGKAVDMWSVGCVVAEMLLRRPLFPGTSSLDQMSCILSVLGSPRPAHDLTFIAKPEALLFMNRQPHRPAIPWPTLFPDADPALLHLTQQLLAFHPDHRLTAEAALEHPYFAGVRDSSREISAGFTFEFEYANQRMSRRQVQRRVYRETLRRPRSRGGSSGSSGSSGGSGSSSGRRKSTAAATASDASAASAASAVSAKPRAAKSKQQLSPDQISPVRATPANVPPLRAVAAAQRSRRTSASSSSTSSGDTSRAGRQSSAAVAPAPLTPKVQQLAFATAAATAGSSSAAGEKGGGGGGGGGGRLTPPMVLLSVRSNGSGNGSARSNGSARGTPIQVPAAAARASPPLQPIARRQAFAADGSSAAGALPHSFLAHGSSVAMRPSASAAAIFSSSSSTPAAAHHVTAAAAAAAVELRRSRSRSPPLLMPPGMVPAAAAAAAATAPTAAYPVAWQNGHPTDTRHAHALPFPLQQQLQPSFLPGSVAAAAPPSTALAASVPPALLQPPFPMNRGGGGGSSAAAAAASASMLQQQQLQLQLHHQYQQQQLQQLHMQQRMQQQQHLQQQMQQQQSEQRQLQKWRDQVLHSSQKP